MTDVIDEQPSDTPAVDVPLLAVQDIEKQYYQNISIFKRERIDALKPTTFSLNEGETLAVIGDSGSGKSTLGKLLAGAEQPSGGQIFLNGEALDESNEKQRNSEIRFIFQDPKSSLNPSVKVGNVLSAPLTFNTQKSVKERLEKIRETLLMVGLLPEHTEYYPHMLSTGQLQRVALARALILDPKILVLDEAVASLDPSVRAQIVNLLLDLQDSQKLSYILITHHLGVVKHISDMLMVLHQGEIAEFGSTEALFAAPKSKHTQRLLTSQDF